MSNHGNTKEITDLILDAATKARKETSAEPEPALVSKVKWPVECTVGPGLEGAIACESEIGYVNGTKGWLIYRGYDIFDLCANSTFEEVSYLLLHGDLPTEKQLDSFKSKLAKYRELHYTLRLMMHFPIDEMNTMAAMRLGSNLMRQRQTYADLQDADFAKDAIVGADEDSIPMETVPKGEKHAIYEIKKKAAQRQRPKDARPTQGEATGFESCYHLIAGLSNICGTIARLRAHRMPLEPYPDKSHAWNTLYMMTGKEPTPLEERIMDVCLILHADHGMNASTFASMVVASTLSDIYFSIGAGIAALNGPLHGGANEKVLHTLREVGDPANVQKWYKKARAEKRKVMGFGHRVYKAYDPRARVLGPLAEMLVKQSKDSDTKKLFKTARGLEKEVVTTLGKEKGIFPNVDFYSGIVYQCLGIPVEMFTPIFAVSRVSGWTARVQEYLQNNRIFRPRAIYTGAFDRKVEDARKKNKGK